jgi:hypothetical protein
MIHLANNKKFHGLSRELDMEAISLDWPMKRPQNRKDVFYEPLDEARRESLMEIPKIADAHGYEGGGYILGGDMVNLRRETVDGKPRT